MADLLENRYELLERLGSGGMAQVFRAWDHRLGRDVAIKFLAPQHTRDPRVIERFRQEIATLAQFSHPNVVTIFDTGETGDQRLYLVMERLQGDTLDKVLRGLHDRGEGLSHPRLVAIARQLCRALQAAHARSIVHRDIKPSNIFLRAHNGGGDQRDEVKLLDFGIAKALGVAPESSHPGDEPLTEMGAFIGTPHYAAPEMIAPEKFGEPDMRADIFSLGVVLYECATGSLPFAGLPRQVVINKTALEQIPSPSERRPLPRALDTLIRRATALHPDDRYPSVRDLIAALGIFEATLVRGPERVLVDAARIDAMRPDTVRDPAPPPPASPVLAEPQHDPEPADSTTQVRSRPENSVDPSTSERAAAPPVEAMTTSDSEATSAPPVLVATPPASRASIAATVITATLALIVVAATLFMPEARPEPATVGPETSLPLAPEPRTPAAIPTTPSPPPVADTSTSGADSTTTSATDIGSIPEAATSLDRLHCVRELDEILARTTTSKIVDECLFDHDLTPQTSFDLRLLSGDPGRPPRVVVVVPKGASGNLRRAKSCIERNLLPPPIKCSIRDLKSDRKFPK